MTKRVQADPDPGDGLRVLVDRLWPRGISKERADLDAWEKDLGPSADLRTWFGHRPERFEEFAARYRAELDDNPLAAEKAREWSTTQERVTLLYSTKDTEHNQAVVLQSWLAGFDAAGEPRRFPGSAPGSSGAGGPDPRQG